MNNPKITLRYFDARGRAQFLRAWLHVRDIPFTDDRFQLAGDFSNWHAIRNDRALNGPLKRLPVLKIDDELIPETLVIADYLHHRFGDADRLSKEDNRRTQIVMSSAYVDILLHCGTLIWSDILYKGVDLPILVKSTHARIERVLNVLDETLAEWRWVESMHERPITLADCLLWEVLDQTFATFGAGFSLDDQPALAAFYDRQPGRAGFEQLLADTPCQITGRPGEPEMIATIQRMLAEAAGGA